MLLLVPLLQLPVVYPDHLDVHALLTRDPTPLLRVEPHGLPLTQRVADRNRRANTRGKSALACA